MLSYPVLVDDIYDGHQLAGMGSERDVGNAADLDEAFEHLREKDSRELHIRNDKLWVAGDRASALCIKGCDLAAVEVDSERWIAGCR